MSLSVKHAFLESATLRGTFLFFLGALAASAAILGFISLSSGKAIDPIPTVFSSADECERTTGEACFLRECTPGICPARFEKAWMPQSVASYIRTATGTDEVISREGVSPGPIEASPASVSEERACSSSDDCPGNGICAPATSDGARECHRVCKTESDCSLAYEEGSCTAEGWCSGAMIVPR